MAGPTTMRLSSVLALLRPALPLILGLSLGCSLSLLRVSWIQGEGDDPCVEALGEAGGSQSLDSRTQLDQSDEDFKPRIVPYYRDPNKPYKKVLRTRYIQTELGSRERLLVAVLTSRATLSTLAVAVNRTVAHHFPRLLYFTGQRGARTPAGMQVVSHGDERPAWLMSETLRHLHTHFGADYDWFFIMQDDTGSSIAQDNRWRGCARPRSMPARAGHSGGGAEQVAQLLVVGQSTSAHPTGRGLLLATVGSLVGQSLSPSSRLTPQLGEVPCSLKNTQNTQRVLIVGASLSTQHDNEVLFREKTFVDSTIVVGFLKTLIFGSVLILTIKRIG